MLTQLDLARRFNASIPIPNVNTQQELAHLLRHTGAFSDRDQSRAIAEIESQVGSKDIGLGVKQILNAIGTAKQDEDVADRFAWVISDAIASAQVV